jgi:hypothetical protein
MLQFPGFRERLAAGSREFAVLVEMERWEKAG